MTRPFGGRRPPLAPVLRRWRPPLAPVLSRGRAPLAPVLSRGRAPFAAILRRGRLSPAPVLRRWRPPLAPVLRRWRPPLAPVLRRWRLSLAPVLGRPVLAGWPPAVGRLAGRTSTGRHHMTLPGQPRSQRLNEDGEPSGSPSLAKSGGDLLSQGVSTQVPSALVGLTSVFGMGTGVTPPPSPPKPLCSCQRGRASRTPQRARTSDSTSSS